MRAEVSDLAMSGQPIPADSQWLVFGKGLEARLIAWRLGACPVMILWKDIKLTFHIHFLSPHLIALTLQMRSSEKIHQYGFYRRD